jgi:hypothetical protein
MAASTSVAQKCRTGTSMVGSNSPRAYSSRSRPILASSVSSAAITTVQAARPRFESMSVGAFMFTASDLVAPQR